LAALAGGDSGPVIVSGKSEESELVARMESDEENYRMPPKGERLGSSQIRLIRRWIDEGANWPVAANAEAEGETHWSYRPIVESVPPEVLRTEWASSAIDRFVLARLERAGLSPSLEADRLTQLRRLHFDLVGLPPHPDRVAEFLRDQRPTALARLVDRLLASPHFGERMGRHWLDLARYADSDGYEKDTPRLFAYRYRDWVIDAINRDLPFDQFTIEQLAGDLIPGASLAQKIATGFHRNTLSNKEGGVDQEEFRVAAVVDRVNTTGSVWLGLTVGCAQCHSHKYDQLLQKEYYGLFAFFDNADEVDVDAPLPSEAEAFSKAKLAFDQEHNALRAELDRYDREERPSRQAAWEKSTRFGTSWEIVRPYAIESEQHVTFESSADGSIRAVGENPPSDTYHLEIRTDREGIHGIRVEVLPVEGASSPGRSPGPGRSPHGNFVLSELRVFAGPAAGDGVFVASPVRILQTKEDFAQEGFGASQAIDGVTNNPKNGWAIVPRTGQAHRALFQFEEPLPRSDGGTRLRIALVQSYGSQHTIARFRIAISTDPQALDLGTPDDVIEILGRAESGRSEVELARLSEYHRTIDEGYQSRAREVGEHEEKAPKPPESKAPTLAERANERRATHVLERGDFLRPGDSVSASAPRCLPALLPSSSGSPTRLDLAQWLVSPSHPLPRRVHANRVWRMLFGRAIVTTLDDFGTRGDPPSHPELLDWLASDLSRSAWSQKALIRTIVHSSAYRQAAQLREDLSRLDPANVLVGRQARIRAEAEVIRDFALEVSGLLRHRVGGPSVKPPQPSGISELTYSNSMRWDESKGDDRYRRGLYTHFQRTSPYPMLTTFDAPDGNVCAARRERSNTPLQALTLLNDAVFVECARALARRIREESPTASGDEPLRRGFRITLGRDPEREELPVLRDLLEELTQAAGATAADSARLVSAEPEASSDPQGAALVGFARLLLNLDEFVMRP
jgi:hypothetical protein